MRARVAAGLFERISEWNGYGRILLPSTAGIDAIEDQAPGETPPPLPPPSLPTARPPLSRMCACAQRLCRA